MQKDRKLLRLFTGTLTLSACTFGGGFVIISLMKKQFVDGLHYLEEEEMLNLTAIAQSAPGPVAFNAAILLGYKVAGIPGALVSMLGTVLPPLCILSIISLCYDAFRSNPVVAAILRGMQAGVAAVIADVVLQMGGKIIKGRDVLSILIMAAAFAATYFAKINAVWIILFCGLAGGLRAYCKHRKGKKAGA